MNSTSNRTTIVGVFEDRAHAQQAINELKQAGFTDKEIGVTSREASETGHGDAAEGDSYAAEGGMAGLATGAGVGALWGLAIISNVLPGIGPAIAGGTIAAILSSAAAGAAAAGLAGMLIGLGIPREEAEFYEGEFRAGRTLVTVQCGAHNVDAQAILRKHGGYDIHSQGGLEGKTAMAATPSHSALHSGTGSSLAGTMKSQDACSTSSHRASQGSAAALSSGQGKIQATEEEIRVHKQREQAGEVTVRKEVHTEHKKIDVPVEREEVVIERHAVSGHQVAGSNLQEGQTIRVPVSEEHVEIEKVPVVKEEVTVGKRKVQDTKHVDATVRKEEIKIDNKGNANVKDCR